MSKEIQLITLYCAVSHHYNSALVIQAQRCSNNFCPKFTDEECIATYIWGLHNQKYDVKACYEFIKNYYGDWFPNLPSYQAYNNRICFLADAFKAFANILLCGSGLDPEHNDYLYDSLPIVVAGPKRSGRAKTASEMCSKGYCASKDMWYYGVKLHTLPQSNHKSLPTPALMMVSKASEHDLVVAKEMLKDVTNMTVFGDKAFIDFEWQTYMQDEHNVTILTPIKQKKNEVLSAADKLFSSAVSSVKQAIESLNNWIIVKTDI